MRILLTLCLFSSLSTIAQFTITPDSNANLLAQKIAGNGLTVFNASLNCGPNAAGTFDYTGSSIAISKGIILSTGHATDIANSGGTFISVNNGNTFSDPDLMAIEPQATNDVCMLECDVIAMYANINVNFIFGSEEYPEYVGSSFNDAFGFFLTGPNPAGGYYSGTNIGSLPNGTPVSINNVNTGANPAFYYDNTTSPNNDVVFDGYTVLITSIAPIYADSIYHMKIAIADAGDQAYDSGILIQDSLFVSKPNTTGIGAVGNEALQFFPNPAQNTMHVNMKITESSIIDLFNELGQRLELPRIDRASGTLDVSSLANGIYFLRVTDVKGRYFAGKFTKN